MYSHGSSARAAVGKRGHGGRPYRPPRKRRDPNSAPPPLKECSCLVEIHLPEYATPQPSGRVHSSFNGRQGMEQCERNLRSEYQVHVMVPGKKQKGPVTMVSKTYREAIPALASLFQEHLAISSSPPNSDGNNDNTDETAATATATATATPSTSVPILGRIHRNVKDPRVGITEGVFLPDHEADAEASSSSSVPYWLFRSPDWSVLTCSLLRPADDDQQDATATTTTPPAAAAAVEGSNTNKAILALGTCLDNIIFRLGKESIGQLDMFMDPYQENSFAVGNANQGEILRREIVTSLVPTTIN